MDNYLENKIRALLINVEKNDTFLTDERFEAIVQGFDFKFPLSYIFAMKIFNSGEGEVGNESWLCLFPIEELKEINENYSLLMSAIPDYFLFGKDAADTGYAFNKDNGTFHSFGLMSNFKTDSIKFVGNDFIEFLEYLEAYRYDI